MRRCSSNISSSPLVALALLLLVCFSSFSFHCAAAARLLQPAVALPLIAHHEKNGGNAAAAAAAADVAASDGLVLQSASGVSGDELSASSEMMGAEEACEEGNDECLERRLLGDAHLDYIYTQHKGKP